MRSLLLPALAHSDVLSLCLNATSDLGLKGRLMAISQDLILAADSFDTHANAKSLDLLPRRTQVGAVTRDELVALYAEHMSATKGAARAVYDHIRNAAPNKKCPLCGIGTVAVLDHHLPKAKYPDLSIVSANLVPACHFCNDTKRARYPKNPGEQTLHPYYDEWLLSNRWISAALDHGTPPVLVYSASPPSSWSQIDQQRVRRHFNVCGLGKTYTSNANDDLGPLKARLVPLEKRGGSAAVQAYLMEEAASFDKRQNSWQLSMFETLASDQWFVAGGFHSIA